MTVTLTGLSLSQLAFGQNNSAQAKNYFSKYKDKKTFTELCIKSLPTLEECKLVFKGQNAYTYFGSLEDWKKVLNAELKKQPETYVELIVQSFTTEDIQRKKGNYAGGMQNLSDKLLQDITFYNIDMLKEKGDKDGVNYQSWVNINGKWVCFPKPWQSFGKSDAKNADEKDVKKGEAKSVKKGE